MEAAEAAERLAAGLAVLGVAVGGVRVPVRGEAGAEAAAAAAARAALAALPLQAVPRVSYGAPTRALLLAVRAQQLEGVGVVAEGGDGIEEGYSLWDAVLLAQGRGLRRDGQGTVM